MSGRLKLLSGTALAAMTALSLSAAALGLAIPMRLAQAQENTVQQGPDVAAARDTAPQGATGFVETTDSAGMGTSDTAAPAASDPVAAVPAPVSSEPPAAVAGATTHDPVAPATTAAVQAPAPTAPQTSAPPTIAPEPLAPAAAEPAPQDAAEVPAAAPPATTPAPATAETPPPAGAEPPASVTAAPEPPVVDPVAMQVSALLESTALDAIAAQKNERDALAAFYAARGGEPIFTTGHEISPFGKAVQAVFAASAADGLSPSDYAVAMPKPGATDADIAATELRLAAATLSYARHLQVGRFNPSRISENVDPTLTPPDPAAVLALVTTTPNVRTAFASFAPQYPGYVALKAKLAEMRPQQSAVTPPQVPPGKVLRPNMSDPRVPILRARLGLPGEADNLVYDYDLVEAVKAFQAKVGQPPSGIIGKGTLSAMNDTGDRRVADIIANMERWRWLPHEMAPTYVMVNIPEFMVRIVKDGKPFHETKVIVGKPENQTPLLTHDMEYIVFNPSWNVPPGIARKEMLPRLAADPYYLARQGIDVVRNGRVVDPGWVDWSRGTQGYSFRQPPGERNALGRIKFMFPNKHSVYLHDTPSRSLFANDRRAYSHGCVRVFEPLKFGEAIFALGMPQDPWSQGRISKQLGGKEKYVNLKQRFPVHLVYFTTLVNDAGALVSREDLYGINAQTKLMLGLDGSRRVADRGVTAAPAR
ncbi:MAG: ErfK/YbiS/YcfS/YnhG family protein [Xanthobacteraceae bacterium]|jgi:murein L,D-transpeptidase YcbB/YkuD|nr:ErfK/YbiS/YcfS/YnhG family protein [Xanthobacteraceae bacterium]